MRFSRLCALAVLAIVVPNLAIAERVFDVPPTSSADKALAEVVLGSLDAPVHIIMYFSPTCNHCADYEKNFFPEIEKNFIEMGHVRFTFRLLPFHRLDYTVARLIWRRGNQNVIKLMQFFLTHQDEWLDPVLEESTKKRRQLLKEALEKTAEQLKMDVDKLAEDLDVQTNIEGAFVKLFALRNGFSFQEIEQADLEDSTLEDALTANHLQATLDFGKSLDYVPAFLVNGKVVQTWPKPKSIEKLLEKLPTN
ncbi:DsbA family protein [Candidatus Finniella inopinata]|uniref:Thioredoxin-like fold domain-containing protein n=1 Tax=Candidatus Finniella inopinata TaxID=1696036 RepID=A0A4Q7DFC9_9PROT|nr:thioredoxin domain-containing protein [Candidatus Finniella inopinata]RZI45403.1 hypothetical protein EQU50_07200 [Candidatus Finniella inopinata]